MLVCAAINPAIRRDRERDAMIDYLRKGLSLCAAPMNFVPVRILVVLIGIVLFDSNVSFVCVHLAMYVFVDDGPQSRAALRRPPLGFPWIFRSYVLREENPASGGRRAPGAYLSILWLFLVGALRQSLPRALPPQS